MFDSSHPWFVFELSQFQSCINNMLCLVLEQKLRLYSLNLYLPWLDVLVILYLSLETPRCWSFVSKSRGVWSLIKVYSRYLDFFIYNGSRLSVSITFWAWIGSLVIHATKEIIFAEGIRIRGLIIAYHNNPGLTDPHVCFMSILLAPILIYH